MTGFCKKKIRAQPWEGVSDSFEGENQLPLRGSLLALKRKKAKRSAEPNTELLSAANTNWVDFEDRETSRCLYSYFYCSEPNPITLASSYSCHFFYIA